MLVSRIASGHVVSAHCDIYGEQLLDVLDRSCPCDALPLENKLTTTVISVHERTSSMTFSERIRASLESLTPSRRQWLPLYIASFVLIAGFYGLRFLLLQVHAFDPDELYHLHSAWYVSRGELPYKDYFEQHTPWLYFSLAPWYSLFNVDTNFGHAIRFMFLARGLMWLFSGACLVLIFRLGGLWRGARVAWVSAVFLSIAIVFLDKGLEIRPDVPSAAFLLACLVTLVGATRTESGARREAAWRFAASGFLLGAALMFQQKILFVMSGFSVAMLWYLLDPRGHGRFKERLSRVSWQFAGFCAPVLATLGYFALRGALAEFVEFHLLLNLRYAQALAFSPLSNLRSIVRENPIMVALALGGFVQSLLHMFERRRFRRGDFVLVLNTFGLMVGVFLLPVPYRQYYLMLFPLVAIFAATYLVHIADWIAGPRGAEEKPSRRWQLYVEEGLLVTLTGVALWRTLSLAKPLVLHEAFYPWMWAVLLLVCFPLVRARLPGWTLALVLMALCAYPTVQMLQILRTTKNEQMFDRMRYVFENTGPNDEVMDGFTGLGVFRPHAYFYFLLLRDVRAMITSVELDRLLADLESGRMAPKLVFLDRNMRLFSDRVAEFIERNYEPVGEGVIWRPKGPWLDVNLARPTSRLYLGRPPADALAGPGWYAPETEGERSFRRSRGRRSWLRVPIRTPDEFRVTLRARWEYTRAPASFDLAVNEHRAGRVNLAPGWRDYTFTVPSELLVNGVNSFVLTYSTLPYRVDPDYRGRNTLIALEYLQLERGSF